jgi:ribonuclease P protein component
MDHSFSRDLRVLAKADFDRVHAARRSVSDSLLVVSSSRNGLPHSRLGLAVGRVVGNAVVRNRWKRWIREAFRLERDGLPTGFDYVVRPRPGMKGDFGAIRDSMRALAHRLAKRR